MINVRLACWSIAALLYYAQAVPVPVHNPGEIVYMKPVQQLGPGGQVSHPHVVMGGVNGQHPAGHDTVFSPVTHSTHPGLGHSIPMPLNQPGYQHGPHTLTGNVLQMETGHSISTSGSGRYANKRVDDQARHTIASSQHQVAADAHNAAAHAHTQAAHTNAAIGSHAQAAHHTAQAGHHTTQANAHAIESQNHALAAAGQHHGPIRMDLEHVTPSKKDAQASAKSAHQSHQAAAHVLAHNQAATAHTNAGHAHGQAAADHAAAAQRWGAVGHGGMVQHHNQAAAYHAQQQQHHNMQSAIHMNPNQRHTLDPHASHNAATNSHAAAAQSGNNANASHPPPPQPVHYQQPHYGGHYSGGRRY